MHSVQGSTGVSIKCVSGLSQSECRLVCTDQPKEHWLERCVDCGDQTRLKEIYSASDICVFPRASVSCQAALGTGLFPCFSENRGMHHLIRSEQQGLFFELFAPESLADRLVEAAGVFQAAQCKENG